MGPLEYLFGQIENARGQIKRRGLLDLPNIIGEEVARRADQGLLAADQMGSVVPEVKDAGRRAMTEQGLGLLGAIKAYHGSPHKFDKFDMSKIGTGEGAQAYGHGLYFAENKGVADEYRRSMNDWFPGGVKTRPGTAEDAAAAHVAAAIDGQYQNPYAQAKEWIRRQGGPMADKKIAAIEKWQKDGVEFARGGATYEVNLRWPDPAREARDPLGPQHFLDWDKPLSEQPESVRKAINRLPESARTARDPDGPRHDIDLFGKELYDKLQRASASNAGMIPQWAQVAKASPDAASTLRSLGIPGIRYLDAGSRGTGGGTANYVAFDDALVEILKRNGLAP